MTFVGFPMYSAALQIFAEKNWIIKNAIGLILLWLAMWLMIGVSVMMTMSLLVNIVKMELKKKIKK